MIRFSSLGGFMQMRPHTEGGILKELGLLCALETSSDWYVDATSTLRSMFTQEPSMEEVYPVLVEFVMRFKFPKMVDRADVERRLLALGMTEDGLDRLNLMLRNHYRIWDSDF